MIPYLDLRRANDPLRKEIQQAVDGCLRRSSYLRGPETEAFEAEWAAYCGQPYAVACNSGTDALTIAATALKLDRATIQASATWVTMAGRSKQRRRMSRSCCTDGFPRHFSRTAPWLTPRMPTDGIRPQAFTRHGASIQQSRWGPSGTRER
jgi:hypothetical protein